MMMNKYLRLLLGFAFLFLGACKSTQKVPKAADAMPLEKQAKTNIWDVYHQNHLETMPNFQFLQLKAKVQFSNDKMNQSLSADVRIEKDKQIIMSLRFLGITVAKAYFSPNRAAYYEKVGSTYFDGDYTILRKWLPIALQFHDLQKLFLGQLFLEPQESVVQQEQNDNWLWQGNQKNINIAHTIQKSGPLVFSELKMDNQVLKVRYDDFVVCNAGKLPQHIAISAPNFQNSQIQFTVSSFSLTATAADFAFKIPEGYQLINLK